MNIPLTIKNLNSSCCETPKKQQTTCCNPLENKEAKSTVDEQSKELNNNYPVAIIGAGPIGLASAAHLSLANQSFIIFEKGSEVADNIKSWQHIQLFSPWKYNIDKAAKSLLEQTGWVIPEDEVIPTGKEIREDYLQPLASLPELKPFISFNSEVIGISKRNHDKMKSSNRQTAPFVIYTEKEGETKRILASAVLDATGTWASPNPIQADNIWTATENKLADNIFYGIPNIESLKERYTGKRIAVIGGGHSAINTILQLGKLDNVEITWVLRKKSVTEAYGGEENDALAARGKLGSLIHDLVDQNKVKVLTPFYIEDLIKSPSSIIIKGDLTGEEKSIEVEEIIANTGSRPDFSFLKEIRLSIDPAVESVEALAPLIDPNLHSCGTVRPHGEEILRQPETGFYIVGMKSYGRAPTFLMATGYEQVRSIVAYLAGDINASREVKLDLPETGVCSVDLSSSKTESNCC